MIQIDTATFTVIGSIVVALIGAGGIITVRRTRGPVTIQDVWGQLQLVQEKNDKLTARVEQLEVDGRKKDEKHDAQVRINRIMGDGFDALANAVERSQVAIDFLPSEHQAIDHARSLRSDGDLWPTLGAFPKE